MPNQDILRDAFNGRNYAEIAAQYGLPVQEVYRIMRDHNRLAQADHRRAALTDQPRSSNEQPDKNSMNEVSNPAASPLDKGSCASGPKRYKATPACDSKMAKSPIKPFFIGLLLVLAGSVANFLFLVLSRSSRCSLPDSLLLLDEFSKATMIVAIAIMLLPEKKA